MTLYAVSDFTSLDFGTSSTPGALVTGPSVTPIVVTIDDDDGFLNLGDGTPPTINSAPGGSGISVGDVLTYAVSHGSELKTASGAIFAEVTVGGTTYIAVANGGAAITPNTTYSEVGENSVVTMSSYGMWALTCFAEETLITTSRGEVPVETLRVGNLVKTIEGGLVPIRWLGRRDLTSEELEQHCANRPIRISANALADGVPYRDLYVSQQHRILLRSKIVKRIFDVDEILVPAKKLLAIPGVELATVPRSIAYHHILCDQHEVLISNGLYAESLWAGAAALKEIGSESLRLLQDCMPHVLTGLLRPRTARIVPVKQRKVASLLERHIRNGMPYFVDKLQDERVLPHGPSNDDTNVLSQEERVVSR